MNFKINAKLLCAVAVLRFPCAQLQAWRREYNESRPHRALGERTPNEFAHEVAASRDLMGSETAENSP